MIVHGPVNYDSHFIMQELHRYKSSCINVIPKSSEHFLTFGIGDAQFKDSYHFLGASLVTLVSNLHEKGDGYFTNVNHYMPSKELNSLLKCKGVFPYFYLNSVACLSKTSLPGRDSFFNELSLKEISQEEYAFVHRVWSAFSCTTLRDYMEVYLLSDVLLLADVFENFRGNCLESYKLDPPHYFTSVHFTFDAFLQKCNPSLDYFHDVDHYLFCKASLHGGLSMVTQRYSVANNKHVEGYNPTQVSKYLLYLDANNLYGWAMSQTLPCGGFEWMSPKELHLKNIMSIPKEGPKGCFVQVTLEYPQNLHNEHTDYPLAPVRMRVSYSDLLDYSKCLANKYNLKVGDTKLMGTLLPKHAYILHYRVLQFYVSKGLIVKTIHRGLHFHQSKFIRPYIEFNAMMRAKATCSFDVDFFKLLSNSLFGKTIEQEDKRSKLKLVSDPVYFKKLSSKPTFGSLNMIHKGLVSITMKCPVLKLDKPSYIGYAILDLSRLFMSCFHYNFMLKKFSNS